MSCEITDWLLNHYGQELMNPGLSRTIEILETLPKIKAKIVTIAGTNGKGETSLWLSKYLKSESHCVWISPHIERITERFRDELGEIHREDLWRLIQSCHEIVQSKKLKLSFYEFLFFVFCSWVREKNPKYLILEVGLGGRLDAVNALEADLVLIPSISRDHQEILGRTYAAILREKLALVRKDKVLLSYLSLEYLREKTSEIMNNRGAKSLDLEFLKLFKAFEFSNRNQLLAYAAFLYLHGTDLTELKDLKSYENFSPESNFLEHRGEVIHQDGEKIFFGSHNVDGLRKLIQFLHRGNYNFSRPPFSRVLVSFSKRSTEDLVVMLKMLKGSGIGNVVITHFPHPKSAPGPLLEKLAHHEGLKFVTDLDSYLQNECLNKSTLVLGSYYFLGHIKSLIRRH